MKEIILDLKQKEYMKIIKKILKIVIKEITITVLMQ